MNQRANLSAGVIFLLALVVLLNYIDRGSLATAAPLLQDELGLTSTEIGILLSAFFWTYAPGQLFAGWAAHRFAIPLVLTGGVLLWAAATALSGLATAFTTLLLPSPAARHRGKCHVSEHSTTACAPHATSISAVS